MFSVNDVKNGITFELEGEIFQVLEFSHVKPGKGAAIVKAKLKNLRTGSIVEQTFNSSTKVGKAMIEKKTMQYLYSDGDNYVFMDMNTYDQFELESSVIGDNAKFLKENLEVYDYSGNKTSIGIDISNIDKENEIIVGMQTNRPLKRGVSPFGGIRMARQACEAYGYKLSETIEDEFKFRTTHNEGVFRAYTDEMRAARKSHVITGLPDAYGRGRIIGDYRRVALYGVDRLIEEKKKDKAACAALPFDVEHMRQNEELFQQITFLGYMKEMAAMYGFDISKPAANAKEAIQWTYFAYLGAIKEQNGAAMSIGRISTFLDIYATRDLENDTYTVFIPKK